MTSRRRARRVAVMAVLLGASVLLGGCWHMIPLEKRGLVSLLAIDAAPAGRYQVTVAVIQPPGLPPPGPSGQGGGAGGTPVFLRSASSRSVAAAVQMLTESTYLHLDFTHLEAVLVSESVARSGLAPALDYIADSPELSQTAWLLVVRRGTAHALLETTEKDLPRPNEVLSQTVEWTRIHTPYQAERVMTAFKEMPLAGMAFTTAGTSAGTSQSGAQTVPFVVAPEALFRGDRLVGWLQGPAALGWAVAMQHIHHQLLTESIPLGRFDLEMVGARRQIRVAPDGSHPPRVALTLRVNAHLADMVGSGDFWQSPQRLQTMEAAAAQLLAADVEDGLRTAQAAGADIFGLGEHVRLQDPAYWDLARADWSAHAFPALPVDVHVRVTVSSVGEILCPLIGRC